MKKLTYCLLFLLLAESIMGSHWTVEADDAHTPQSPTTVTSVAAGNYFMLALLSDGTVMSWGRNTAAQLGDGTIINRAYAVTVRDESGQPLSDVAAVTAGAQHSLALKNDGTVYSWGNNGSGEIGRSGNGRVAMKINGFNNKKIIQLSAGESHSLALDEDGDLWAWGLNIYGQIGIGIETTKVATPVQVRASASTDLGGIQMVAGGQFHSLALTESGEVLAWGMNRNGQLGDGTQSNRSYPVSVTDGVASGNLRDVKLISAKGYNSLALKEDDTLWAWGDNWSGQRGSGDFNLSTSAWPVLGADGLPFGNVKNMAAGFLHAVAVRNDNTLWTWGANQNSPSAAFSYQLGRQWEAAAVPLPGRVDSSEDGSPVDDVVMAVAGNAHTSIVRSDGSVWSVGSNLSNVLGGNRIESSIQKLAQLSFSTRAKSSWTADSPRSAMAGEQVQIVLQLADSQGNPLNIGTDHVEMTADRGEIGSVSYAGAGKFQASFRSEQALGSNITATVNGLEVPVKFAVQVSPAAPSAIGSTLRAVPAQATADGTSKSKLTLELKDAWGNPMTSHVPNVSLAATKGTLGTLTELDFGKYEAELTSTETGVSIVSVLLDNAPFGLSTDVTFLSGDPDAARSVLEADYDEVPIPGEHRVFITLRLYDAFGNALTQSGGEVSFVTDHGQIGQVEETEYGLYTAELKSAVPGQAVVTAWRDDEQLGQAVEVNFVPLITKIVFGASRYETLAGGTVETAVTAYYWNGRITDVTEESTFTISDPSIATVDEYGTVTGRIPGQVTLTAQLDDYVANVPVTVTRRTSGGEGPGPNPNPGSNPGPGANPGSGTDVKPDPGEKPDNPPGKDAKPLIPGGGKGSSGEDKPPQEAGGNPSVISFTDIAGHWAESAIMQAASQGIISGYPDRTFRPQALVTRAEFAAMLARALGLTGDQADQPQRGGAVVPGDQPHGKEVWPAWASGAITALMEHGIIQGYPDGTFGPNRNVTRMEMTAIITRALKLSAQPDALTAFADDSVIPAWGKPLVAAATAHGIVQGRSGNRFAPDETATRAEAAVFILRLLERQ
ncbi:hypothetical protein EBB07_19070 [Paenibacillaceae bacterium]|nr:hypothetical protein EBB07_19070 [Paenibacillaceae bacterium]